MDTPVTDPTGMAPPAPAEEAAATPAPEGEQLPLIADPNDAIRQELADLKRTNEKLAKQLRAQEDTKLAEAGEFKALAEKRSAELQDANARLDLMAKRQALHNEAAKAGLQSMEFLKMVDMSALTLEGDVVTGADAAIAALRTSHPVLFEKTSDVPTPSITPGNNGRTIDPTRAYTSAELESMTDAEFASYREAKYGSTNKNPI